MKANVNNKVKMNYQAKTDSQTNGMNDTSSKTNVGKQNAGKQTIDNTALFRQIQELEEKVRQLALTIDTVEDEKLVVEEKLKKALADYRNLEMNNERRNAIRLSQLKVKLAESIMNIIDDLQYGVQAKDHLELTQEVELWVNGLLASASKMQNVLAELDIKLMDVKVGDVFDSTYHEAISITSEGEGEKGTIVQVVQPGYVMEDQVVRPAKVVIFK